VTRESAIDVRLPELSHLLDRWRLATVHDAAQGMPPHVTLLYPWRPAPVQATDLAEVAAAVRGVSPFTVTFRRLARFPGVLYLAPERDDVLRLLGRRLTSAFPDTPPYGGQFADPVPHLTVARASTEAMLDDLQADVERSLAMHLPIAITVGAIAVDEVGDDGRWRLRSLITVTGSDADPSGGVPVPAGSTASHD